jgi:hypothetical protein
VVPSPASATIGEVQTSASVNAAMPAAAFLISPETVLFTGTAGFTGRTATLNMTPQTPADPTVSITLPQTGFIPEQE